MEKTKRIWMAHRPYSQEHRVFVEYDPFNEVWRVSQRKKEVILCTHLCLRDAEYHNHGLISGYIATFKEIRDEHVICGHDEDELFEYDTLGFDGERWMKGPNDPIYKSDYADMDSTEIDKVLAIKVKE